MVLTIMELWVACDVAATKACPLLLDYATGFTPRLMDPLVLPKREQLKRLAKVEDYLDYRSSEAKAGPPWELSASGSHGPGGSFAVRYFDSCGSAQTIHKKIKMQADAQKEHKLLELKTAAAEYQRLRDEYENAPHRTEWAPDSSGSWADQHMDPCPKCAARTRAENLKLMPFEWPLPDDAAMAKAAIFEFVIPDVFRQWRNITLYILVDIFSHYPGADWRKPLYYPSGDPVLRKVVKKEWSGRFRLASPHAQVAANSQNERHIKDCSESNIIVKHSCLYDLYDTSLLGKVSYLLTNLDLSPRCSYAPSTVPEPLKSWIVGTGHNMNEVIAMQTDCPDAMSLEEFRAFGSMRGVVPLQWHNILCQLAMPTLNFNKPETFFLILQAANQAGPRTDERHVLRDTHSILQNNGHGFSEILCQYLTGALSRIRANWEANIPLAIFACLGTRLLSMAPDYLYDECRDFLRQVRTTAIKWVRDLIKKENSAGSEEERRDLSRRTVTMALVCHATFGVDPKHLELVLQSPPTPEEEAEGEEAAAVVMLESSIAIHQRPASRPRDCAISNLLFHRWIKLSHQALVPLSEMIVRQSNPCLDRAVKKIWAKYDPKSKMPWRSVQGRRHLLEAEWDPAPGQRKHLLRYNLLTGELLVDGAPLSLLPSSYMAHETYKKLFKGQSLPVAPSAVPGMRFETRSPYHGFDVHFSMHEEQLVVLARRPDAERWLVPPRMLQGDIPDLLIANYIHWLDIQGRTIELRPLSDAWRMLDARKLGDSDGYVMTFEDNLADGRARLYTSGSRFLIDIRSNTANCVSRLFCPIENPKFLHLVLDEKRSCLTIELPRLRLSFALRSGDKMVRSNHPRGFIIDQDQSVGALWGLQSKLVLRRGQLKNENAQRVVLVPDGEISFKVGSIGHARVEIGTGPGGQVRHHLFRVDSRLGRLEDTGTLLSKLFLCHLHAVTTHCLPDRLTGRTGTEEALRILSSAAVRSFDGLDKDEISSLLNIARLSLLIGSTELSSLAQHNAFCQIVDSVLKQVRVSGFFCSGDQAKIKLAGRLLAAPVRHQSARVGSYGTGYVIQTSSRAKIADTADIDYTARHAYHSPLERQTYRIAELFESKRWGVVLDRITPASHQALATLIKTSRLKPPSCTCSICRRVSETAVAHNLKPQFDLAWLQPFSATLGLNWFRIQKLITQGDLIRDRYKLLLFIASVAAAREADRGIVQILLALCTAPSLRAIRLPPQPVFIPEDPSEPAAKRLKDLAYSSVKPTWEGAPSRPLSSAIDRFVDELQKQWPCEAPQIPSGLPYTDYLGVTELMGKVSGYFRLCHHRRQLGEYFESIESGTRALPLSNSGSLGEPPATAEPRGLDEPTDALPATADADLFSVDAPLINVPEAAPFAEYTMPKTESQGDRSGIGARPQMKKLLSDLDRVADFAQEKKYVAELRSSLACLQATSGTSQTARSLTPDASAKALRRAFVSHLADCQREVDRIHQEACRALDLALDATFGLTPRPTVTPLLLLGQLSRHRWPGLSPQWKRCLVAYAVSITHVQRAERLVRLVGQNQDDLVGEILNVGHTNWDPMEFPESLIFEVESGVMIRPVQEEIAKQMRMPSSRENSVMQLNMGEGKSSVVVPIVAAALADGTKLVRILVGKAQSKQMMHVLTKKLGGLLDRRVYVLPFSRELNLDQAGAASIEKLCEQCRSAGGVLLMQPEHILSFQLLGLESIIAGKNAIGCSLLQTQSMFDDVSRDIIDESDDNLSVRFELTYTIGSQTPLEFTPNRWLLIQHVLKLVSDFAKETADADPDSLLLGPGIHGGGFPMLRILDEQKGGILMDRVAEHIRDNLNSTPGFPSIPNLSGKLRSAIHAYITKPRPRAAEITGVGSETLLTSDMFLAVLLLRGLFANRILAFALRHKRWRVNYGLDHNHSPPTATAVPYRAKDSPAPRSEFSHPDLRIILTCLSYYYGGLSDDQLLQLLEHLVMSPQGASDYAGLTRSIREFPSNFRQIGSINLKDKVGHARHIFPYLRYHKATIDYFLAQILFRKEMKGFTKKLTASGWDIAKSKTHVTTGFSGTNDSKYLLPLSIGHLDLDGQRHTNASVLDSLLRPENTVCEIELERARGAETTPDRFLSVIAKAEPKIRVILDVGAQILDLRNLGVAQRWLEMDSSAEAAVYVDDDDELSTVTRTGYVEPLFTSPYATDMSTCLVFLDEAHTRGIDLQLPDHYRAAVLLGPNLVKDKLVQACMRMRKLGRGQSVVFVVPPEVRQKIYSHRLTFHDEAISTADILGWSISETWADCIKGIQLWATQGIRFQRQHVLWSRIVGATVGEQKPIHVRDALKFIEDESQGLKSRYAPRSDREEGVFAEQFEELADAGKEAELQLIRDRCSEFGVADFADATLHEEQQRELMVELQTERVAKRLERITAHKPTLHPAVREFVRRGYVAPDLCGFQPAFASLRDTSAAEIFDPEKLALSRDLLVTEDFAHTVDASYRTKSLFKTDQYQQPVQWVVTRFREQSGGHSAVESMVIFSPWEVGQLLGEFGTCRGVVLHLFAPRTSLSYPALDDLRLYSVPQLPVTWDIPPRRALQLNLFAGSLYLSDHNDYLVLCEFLGLSLKPGGDGGRGKRLQRWQKRQQCPFIKNPLAFLKTVLMTIRRDGRDISRTDIGRILAGEILQAADFTDRHDSEEDDDDDSTTRIKSDPGRLRGEPNTD
ncbi:hypothetical protein B0T25DRAFT_484377 [Lasiosphaeria hispida]|uniref:ubiquitinyl hydrolase 1 n=1 Tax=Lasiosphaeria hispida TaxID=260671 RepID=A0AAJ0MB37_9PEZI|nr:hypothetical protein B0T25DRAFT_484377 [Lasiosphaeria hispida]